MLICHKLEKEDVTMIFLVLGIGLFLLPILFRLALKLRLGIPMLYAVLALTVFHRWYQANPALGDAIFFALVGLVALSWVVTAVRKIYDVLDVWRGDRAVAQQFADRVRQARAEGGSMVSAEGLDIFAHIS